MKALGTGCVGVSSKDNNRHSTDFFESSMKQLPVLFEDFLAGSSVDNPDSSGTLVLQQVTVMGSVAATSNPNIVIDIEIGAVQLSIRIIQGPRSKSLRREY